MYVELFPHFMIELKWWQEVIYCDVSENAWGPHFQGANTSGNWSLQERSYHMNVKEIFALFFAPKYFAKPWSNLKVKM